MIVNLITKMECKSDMKVDLRLSIIQMGCHLTNQCHFFRK